MIVIPSKHFEKAIKKLPTKIRASLAERLRMFMEDPFDSLLNNHALKGSLRNYRSINITGDYRLIYEEYDKKTVRLIDVDTHNGLYEK